jgi:hypothetical protein
MQYDGKKEHTEQLGHEFRRIGPFEETTVV